MRLVFVTVWLWDDDDSWIIFRKDFIRIMCSCTLVPNILGYVVTNLQKYVGINTNVTVDQSGK